MQERRNLVLNGSGSASGGLYNQVKVRGDGQFSDDIECNTFKIFGTSQLLGRLKTGKLSVYGDADIKQSTDIEELKIYGTVRIGEAAIVKWTKVRGTLDIRGAFRAEEADIKGTLSAQGNVEAENLAVNGGFQINGLLNAGKITVSLRFGDSSAEEIGGERIVVKRRASLIPYLKNAATLQAQIIEGDHIYLEHTRAEVVRGKHVEIGPGCKIERVEYTQKLKVGKNSIVKDSKKV